MGKPYGRVLETINGVYFYDVNRNAIIEIDSDIARYIQTNQRELESLGNVELIKEKVEAFRENGYLSDKTVREICHPETKHLKYHLNRKVRAITLQVTQMCNLRCSYCPYSEGNNGQTRTHGSNVMSVETAKKAIDFLADRCMDNEVVSVTFYGGEPLLEGDLIKEAVLYAEKVLEGKRVRFSMTTNGTLLNSSILPFLEEHDFFVTVSLDGPKDIHDTNRRFAANGRGTYDAIIKNLQIVDEKYPKLVDKMSINMVIDPRNNFKQIEKLFVYDKEHEIFHKINVGSTIEDDTYSFDKIYYQEEFIQNSNYGYFLACLKKLGLVEDLELSPLQEQFVEGKEIFIREMVPSSGMPDVGSPSGPCIPGQQKLFVSVDGTLFPCERVSETSECMKIGTLDEGFDYEKADTLLNISKITAKRCQNCWAFWFCEICAKAAEDGDNLSPQQKTVVCSTIKPHIEENLYYYLLKKEVADLY